ncbi:S8 family peptidase [Jidongwangia harbinensis]|uniref:S8 family peptidase n=1 Tax=Jidongwangia harbinensis TaxID=2878561 RepID=UPI001CD9EE65|nr:S8 family serine peptidase [Jidongwangia harbinensis]MCA2211574.1 S8 family serine peptidase [Jidongwangia harbinensis]
MRIDRHPTITFAVARRVAAALLAAVLGAALVPAPAGAVVAAAPPGAAADVRVIVRLRTPFDPQAARRSADRDAQRSGIAAARAAVESGLHGVPHTVHHRYDAVPYLALTAPAAAVAALRASGRIVSVQPDEAGEPLLDDSTGIVGATGLTARGLDGTGQIVAVLDTGVDRAHPFLAGRVVEEACYSSSATCPNGATTQTGTGSGVPCTFAATDCRHGTHVAGIAAGRRAGTMTFDGVAPDAGVMSVQVFSRVTADCRNDAPVCAQSFASDQLAGLNRIINRVTAGLDVAAVNISIGSASTRSTACDTDSRKTAIDTLRTLGVPTVISSGNGSSNTGVSTPACISTSVTVGNTTKADEVRTTSNSSPQVELLAPGTSITSSVPGGGTAALTGTSMAAPHVAGAWAVYRERFPDAAVDTVLAALRATGVPVTDPDNTVTVPRLDIGAALAD